MENFKKMIPNILTLSRIVFTPIIIILGLFDKTNWVIVLAIICALTDLIDGKLARKWNVVSEKGAKLDVVADKVFAIGLIACLIRKFNILIFPLILEIIISLTNLYYFKKLNKSKSLMIGKIKTTFLFISIILFIVTIFYNKLLFMSNGFITATINLQILCLIFYYKNYMSESVKLNTTVEDNKSHQQVMYDVELEKTLQVNDLVELVEKYNLNDNEDI